MNNVQRYTDYTEADFDEAIAWLSGLPAGSWIARRTVLHDGWVSIDMDGMPTVLAKMVKDQFTALELMTPREVRRYVDTTSMQERVEMVEDVLDRAGR